MSAAQFTAAGLIDEMIVTYAPCSLGGGSRLLPIRSDWELVESGVNGDFVCATLAQVPSGALSACRLGRRWQPVAADEFP